MKKIGWAGALLLGFVAGISLGFTAPSAPSRHARLDSNVSITAPALYLYDPYTPGASAGTPNVSGKLIGVSGCTATQAIGIYDDGGSVGVNCLDTNNVATQTFSDQTSHPATPSANSTIVYEWVPSLGAPSNPMKKDSVMGIPIPEGLMSQFSLLGTTANWQYTGCFPRGFGVTTQSVVGNDVASGTCSTYSTSTTTNWASTNLYTRSPTYQSNKTTAGGTNAWAGNNFNTAFYWRGINAGEGGFFLWTRIFFVLAPNDGNSINKTFIGVSASGAALSGSSNPSAFLDTAYFGNDLGETQQLRFCTNDNSGAATCSASLGANYPVQAGAWYDLYIWAPPAAAAIYGTAVRLDSAQNSGLLTASSDLPRNTVQLTFQNLLGSGGADAGVTAIGTGGTIVLWNY